MSQYTRRGWMKPAMVIFGSQLAFAKQDDETDAEKAKRPKRQGQFCGESVIRYGAVCGIRTGEDCATRHGINCKDRIGNNCYGRIGQNCQERMGPLCNNDRMGQPCVLDNTDNNAN